MNTANYIVMWKHSFDPLDPREKSTDSIQHIKTEGIDINQAINNSINSNELNSKIIEYNKENSYRGGYLYGVVNLTEYQGATYNKLKELPNYGKTQIEQENLKYWNEKRNKWISFATDQSYDF